MTRVNANRRFAGVDRDRVDATTAHDDGRATATPRDVLATRARGGDDERSDGDDGGDGGA